MEERDPACCSSWRRSSTLSSDDLRGAHSALLLELNRHAPTIQLKDNAPEEEEEARSAEHDSAQLSSPHAAFPFIEASTGSAGVSAQDESALAGGRDGLAAASAAVWTGSLF